MIYTVFWGVARALHLASRAATYLAAGALRRRQLDQAIANTWDDFYRSETAILSGLNGWERNFYGRALKRDDHILVVGCGTGRDLIALLRLGHRVDGVDISAGPVEVARAMVARQRLSATLYTGAVDAVPATGRYDAVIFSWFCYGYIPEAASRVATLRSVRDRLKPGGRVLISYNLAASRARLAPIRLTRMVARLTSSDWRPEPGDVIGPLGPRGAVHFEHEFGDGELEREARAAGFTVVSDERDDAGTAVLTL